MDHFRKLSRQAYRYTLAMTLLAVMTVIGIWWFGSTYIDGRLQLAMLMLGAGIVAAMILSIIITSYVLQPLHYVWQAVLHVSPENMGTAAPDTSKIKIGRELITSLILQVYQFSSQQDGKAQAEHRAQIIQSANIVNHMPLPLFAFNKQQLVTHASGAALEYCQLDSTELFGKPLFDNLNLEFSSERTLETWIAECQDSRVTDSATWDRVRVRLKDQKTIRQCDVAASYNRDNSSGTEFVVTLFDRTDRYSRDDQNLSFVALAVHELRTPLTSLRGYVEVFEEELAGKLDPELTDFMHKMQIASQQLSAFVHNILNVARIEEDQLVLHLNEEQLDSILRSACNDMQPRASLRGIAIEYQTTANLPTVGVDRVGLYEVMYNLLDNAIKYSSDSMSIVVACRLSADGMVEISVQDSGVGIPASVIPHLFEKFYRNHRTKSQVGGTGLGLYLSKAVIEAHGGNIWIKSREGEGTTLTFTVQPYARLADEEKSGSKTGIVRSAHGWIKNHSLYRR